MKYSPENTQVTVELEHEEDMVCISVKDQGMGIDDAHINNVFERFYRVDTGRSRAMGGTGLGLSISKELVELQGGEIEVKSVENEGSEFSFHLFLNEVDEGVQSKESDKDFTDVFTGKKILLAEDNKINTKVAMKVLAKAGIIPEVVQNGIEAVKVVQNKKFDLILMDLHMPILDGIGATQAIRKLGGEYLNIPIIALTAEVLGDVQDRIAKAGMNKYAAKPLVAKKLFEDMYRLLYPEV